MSLADDLFPNRTQLAPGDWLTRRETTVRNLQTVDNLATVQIRARRTAVYHDVTLTDGEPVRCPRCGRDDNWRPGGHSRAELWVCGHGVIDGVGIEDVVTLPRWVAA